MTFQDFDDLYKPCNHVHGCVIFQSQSTNFAQYRFSCLKELDNGLIVTHLVEKNKQATLLYSVPW